MNPFYCKNAVASLWLSSLVILLFWHQQAKAVVAVKLQPFIRLPEVSSGFLPNKHANYIAFTDVTGTHLSLLDMRNKHVLPIAHGHIGRSYFWSPDQTRLLYRVQENIAGTIHTKLFAYDAFLKKEVMLDQFPHATGQLTYDPREMKLHMFHKKGVISKRLMLPDYRPAKWQLALRQNQGKWLVTQNNILWMTADFHTIKKIMPEEEPIISFSISPDGQSIAWSTAAEKLFVANAGKTPKLLGIGRHPSWHFDQTLLVYSAARFVGDKIRDYDLRIVDLEGDGKFVSQSQHSREQWPAWHPDGQRIIYGVEKSADVYLLTLNEK